MSFIFTALIICLARKRKFAEHKYSCFENVHRERGALQARYRASFGWAQQHQRSLFQNKSCIIWMNSYVCSRQGWKDKINWFKCMIIRSISCWDIGLVRMDKVNRNRSILSYSSITPTSLASKAFLAYVHSFSNWSSQYCMKFIFLL